MLESKCTLWSQLHLAYLRSVIRLLQHDGAVAEFLHKAILALDGCSDCEHMETSAFQRIGEHILAYEISATLSLLKQFLLRVNNGSFDSRANPYQRWFPRALTNFATY